MKCSLKLLLALLLIPVASQGADRPDTADVVRLQRDAEAALLAGNGDFFRKIPKSDFALLSVGRGSVDSTYSWIQDVCLAHPDKLVQCQRALIGGLRNHQNVGLVCQELLYLDPRPLLESESAGESLAELHARLDDLAGGHNSRVSSGTVTELKARYTLPRAPSATGKTTHEAPGDTPRTLLERRKLIRVSQIGESRATAYTMSNLFFRQQNRLYLSWMDKPLVNCLGELSLDQGQVSAVCVLGRPQDDHGNAAIAQDARGRLHAIVGAHHGPFLHRMADDPSRPEKWRNVAEVGERATHPCLVADREGTLHLVYRSSVQNPWLLNYQRYSADGKWSTPVPLLRAARTWYVTWTNSLVVAPDNTLHLIFGVARHDSVAKASYYGSAHIFSTDGGETWRQFGGPALTPPIDAGKLTTIEDESEAPSRTVRDDEASKWPGTPNTKAPVTLQMLLSNAVVDEKNRPWVVVHNTLDKSATLYSADRGKWGVRSELLATVQKVMPDWVIAEQSALSRHAGGELEAVLPIVPLKGRKPRAFVGWQSNELELIRIVFNAEGQVLGARLVMPPDPQRARWLPSLEKWDWNHPFDHPALLFSSGVSTPSELDGEAKLSAKKQVVMEVWLDVVDQSPLNTKQSSVRKR